MSVLTDVNSSWPGLSRPSTPLLHDGIEKVVPFRIHGNDLSDLPGTWPMLDVMLALDGIMDAFKLFEIDQSFQSISLGEAIHEPRAMLEYASYQVARYPDVRDTVGTVRQDVNVTTCHTDGLQGVDGRDKPGHDRGREFS